MHGAWKVLTWRHRVSTHFLCLVSCVSFLVSYPQEHLADDAASLHALREAVEGAVAGLLKWRRETHEQMSELMQNTRCAVPGLKGAVGRRGTHARATYHDRGAPLMSPLGIQVARKVHNRNRGPKCWEPGSVVDYWPEVGEYVIEWQRREDRAVLGDKGGGFGLRDRVSDPRKMEVLIQGATAMNGDARQVPVGDETQQA